MTFTRLLTAAALATAVAGFAGAAQAGQGHHHGYAPAGNYEPAPRVVVIPETTGFYFKRKLVGTLPEVQQCYKRRAWTSTGELFWSEVCQ